MQAQRKLLILNFFMPFSLSLFSYFSRHLLKKFQKFEYQDDFRWHFVIQLVYLTWIHVFYFIGWVALDFDVDDFHYKFYPI